MLLPPLPAPLPAVVHPLRGSSLISTMGVIYTLYSSTAKTPIPAKRVRVRQLQRTTSLSPVIASSRELRKELPDLRNAPAIGPAVATRVVGKGNMVSVKRHKRHRISLLAGILGLDVRLPAVARWLGCVLALASVAAQHVVAELLAHRGVENAVADAMLAVECLYAVHRGSDNVKMSTDCASRDLTSGSVPPLHPLSCAPENAATARKTLGREQPSEYDMAPP